MTGGGGGSLLRDVICGRPLRGKLTSVPYVCSLVSSSPFVPLTVGFLYMEPTRARSDKQQSIVYSTHIVMENLIR